MMACQWSNVPHAMIGFTQHVCKYQEILNQQKAAVELF